jgi:hypothetical protein
MRIFNIVMFVSKRSDWRNRTWKWMWNQFLECWIRNFTGSETQRVSQHAQTLVGCCRRSELCQYYTFVFSRFTILFKCKPFNIIHAYSYNIVRSAPMATAQYWQQTLYCFFLLIAQHIISVQFYFHSLKLPYRSTSRILLVSHRLLH